MEENDEKSAPFGVTGAFYDHIKALTQKHGLEFIDTFTAFVAQGEIVYFPHDMHWNSAGHELMATLLADHYH